MRCKDIGEDAVIERISIEESSPENIVIGIGDDAAVLSPETGQYTLISCHMLVENSHFLRSKTTPYQVGYKGITKSVADIEAMGGTSLYLLVGLSLPPDTELNFVDELYRGMGDANSKCGVHIIGGDMTDCQGPITISLTIMGEASPERIIKRFGARPGDLVLVTGPLGAAAAGLHLVLNRTNIQDRKLMEAALLRQLQPEPPVGKGSALAATSAVHAMTDISDSLCRNLGKMCTFSNLGATIDREKLPVDPVAQDLARQTGMNAVDWALYGGEDFEMLACVDPRLAKNVEIALHNIGSDCYFIGEITSQPGLWIRENGTTRELPLKGFDHFG